MSIGAFIDKGHRPTRREITSALGARHPLWVQLTQFILDNYQMPGELSFAGKNYGWNLWYRRSGKTLVSLYPQQKHYIAQVVLGKDQVALASQLKLGKNVKAVLEATPQLHDGRWLFIPVRTARDVRDIQDLLRIKKRPAAGKGT